MAMTFDVNTDALAGKVTARLNSCARLIGESAGMQVLQAEIARVARSDAKVLIHGESGSGKEVVARTIHETGPRAKMAFVPVNCAGLPETLLESELFGHVKGSFTDAYRDKPGKLESADDGTIFLDEIGEMSLRMQGLLLRFLETGETQRVGSDGRSRYVNVRVIGATHRNLRDLISTGAFREDLYYRLNVIQIVVPPLRDRREDLPALITHFLGRFVAANGSSITAVTPAALDALIAYSWPGNVRELQNVLERMVVSVQGTAIDIGDLPYEVHARPAPRPERRHLVADDLYAQLTKHQVSFWTAVYPLYMNREITRDHVREVVRRGLEESRGSYKRVARVFSIEPRDYKRFLNFLSKHQCHVRFQEYRTPPAVAPTSQPALSSPAYRRSTAANPVRGIGSRG